MKKSKFIPPFKDIPSGRQKMPHLPLEDRALNFKEVELGFSEEQAIAEAKRCLSCRKCIGCGLCLAECDRNAIVYDQPEEIINIKVDSIILTPGFTNFDANRKKDLGYSTYPNVISSMEFERILSENGPFGGLIVRPLDGEIPRKIAFIQCVGSREEAIGANYCSSICCTNAIKEAIAAKESIGEVEVKIFHRDIRPLGKDSEELFLRAKNELGIKFIRAEVAKAVENPDTGNIRLEYNENGRKDAEEFDLVVLSLAIAPPKEARELGRKFGIRLNKYNFCSTNPFSPSATSKDGIFVAGAFALPETISQSIVQASSAASRAVTATRSLVSKAETLSSDQQATPASLIIGGGISGITAALSIAEQGFGVHVVEKEKEMGGWLSKIHHLPAGEAPRDQLKILLDKIENNDRVQIHKGASIINIQGSAGNFVTTILTNGGEKSIRHDVIIIATGGRVHQAEKFYGENENIISQIELEQRLAEGKFSADNLAMVQCVDLSYGYCSKICCIEAIKNAHKIKELSPNTRIYILHNGIRVYGFDEDLYTDAMEKGIQFIQIDGEPHVRNGKGLRVSFTDKLRKEKGELRPDVLVLNMPMLPYEENKKLAKMLDLSLDKWGFFQEADPISRPLETGKEGIFVCGSALYPQLLSECILQANAAAGKACILLKQLDAERNER